MAKNKLNPGEGFWIWIVNRYRNGDFNAIINDLKHGNFAYVVIKVADWTKRYNQDVDLKAFVNLLKHHGIEPWGFQYIYGINPAEEAKVGARYANELGLHGFIINAEKEFNTQAMKGAAALYMKTLKEIINPNILVGLSSYRFPHKYQRNFTWKEFLSGCDFYAPQVYWMQSHNDAHIQLEQSIADCERIFAYAGVNPKMPIRPTGAAFTEHGWTPTVDELSAFMRRARELKLPAIDWWEAGNCYLYTKQLYNHLMTNSYADGIVAPPEPEPPVEDKELFKAVCVTFELNVREGWDTSFPIVGSIRENDIVSVYEVKNNWYRIGDKRWCSGLPKYMRMIDTPITPEPIDTGMVEVTASNLHIRSAPLVADETIVGYTTKGKKFKVVEKGDNWTCVEVYLSNSFIKDA